MEKKVANGLSGCTDNPHRLDPIKKGRPDNPFCTKFFRRTEVHTDKKLSGIYDIYFLKMRARTGFGPREKYSKRGWEDAIGRWQELRALNVLLKSG